jgi:biotin carboxyl carrier protein
VRAPMPGVVVSVQKTIGAAVRRGETILTIESMKLQMALNAPRDGVIAELPVREGDVFDKDAVLARLEAPALEG